mgnify:CR=1 FL=1
MVIDSPAYKKAIQRLWTGKATVYVRVGALNPTTGRTEQTEQASATEQPCRLSHKTVKKTENLLLAVLYIRLHKTMRPILHHGPMGSM